MPFEYIDRQLCVTHKGGVIPLKDVVTRSPDPIYVYDLDGVMDRLEKFKGSLSVPHSVHFALKANNNRLILSAMAQAGFGVDVVSGGELQLAIDCGFSPERIVFSGVGKTVSEIEKAIQLRIKQINVESPQELKRIIALAKKIGRSARVAFRMNPDVHAETHPYITTGFRENKFGMDRTFLPELESQVREAEGAVTLVGLTVHIGSQLKQLEPMIEAIEKTKEIHNELQSRGWDLKTFDVGGGLGIHYEDGNLAVDEKAIAQYGSAVSEATREMGVEILFEPGRVIVARFGVLIGEVQYIKETPYKNFAILNTGMHHIMRPCLYQAHHRLLPLTQKTVAPQLYDIVGPICESSDVLGKDRALPILEQGDFIAVADAGAYGAVMANAYNSHSLPKEFVVYNGVCQATPSKVPVSF
ncbi:MAG: diaminopimelate decarboxylase [Bdellovibrionales bacterium]|nr:diaminopimelate decarboxylase [Bdellovibrionales bacterium]